MPFGAPYQLMLPELFLRLPGQWTDRSWEGIGASYYNVNRWYFATGRYSQIDPLNGIHGLDFEMPRPLDPESFSPLFAYAKSNPLAYIDPLGLLQFKGCSKDQEALLASGLKSYCGRAQSDSFKSCMCGPGRSIPMGRYGKVAEVAELVALLASERGGYITGQNIRVDGGITRAV